MARWLGCWMILAVLSFCFSAVPAMADEDPPTDDAEQLEHEEEEEDAEAEDEGEEDAKKVEDYYELMEVFVDTLHEIESNYVKKVDRRELVEAAIDGMLEKLDPHSSYIPPADVESFKTTVESEFGGVGIQITVEDGKLTVVSPLVGTPAYKAGVMAGDHITEIEGEPTKGIRMDEAVRRLKGKVGTDVTIKVVHAGDDEEEEIKITRGVIHVETVLGDHRNDDDSWSFMMVGEQRIGYIRVNAFSRDTTRDIRKALETLKKENMRGLILDLRFNPGGLLSAAIETSDLFIDKGRIVSTKGRNTKTRVWNAKAKGTFNGFPMAVLINRYSASASEIVSACLKDHERAVVVGERTWGKGSVQNVIDLEHGKSVLKLTTASYRRPNGKNIHRFPDAKDEDDWGVKPSTDYEVKLSATEMRDLVRLRRESDIVQPRKDADEEKPAEDPDNESADDEFVDRQLQKALEYLSGELARAG